MKIVKSIKSGEMLLKNMVIIFALFFIASACSHSTVATDNDKITSSGLAVLDSQPCSCAHFSTDTKGNIVLSYTRDLNDSQSVVCYCISTDKGKTFGKPVVIPTSTNVFPHGENMPKLIFKPNGEIIAAWGARNANAKNQYAGMIYYSQSFDNGGSWSNPKPLSEDKASHDQRFFDLALLPNGEAAAVFLDNREPAMGMGGSLLCFTTTNGKNGFSADRIIGRACCECCRTDLFVDSKGDIHVAYRDIINDSIRDMVHTVSYDGGKTFESPKRISADNWVVTMCPHSGPTMTENNYGLHFAWYTLGKGNGVFYCNSADDGKTFSSRENISNNAGAKHPQITSLPGGDIVIVWDEPIKKGDKPGSLVGFQHRSAEGKVISTDYISADSLVSTFPVIYPVDDNAALVAYASAAHGQKQHVYYKIIYVDNASVAKR